MEAELKSVFLPYIRENTIDQLSHVLAMCVTNLANVGKHTDTPIYTETDITTCLKTGMRELIMELNSKHLHTSDIVMSSLQKDIERILIKYNIITNATIAQKFNNFANRITRMVCTHLKGPESQTGTDIVKHSYVFDCICDKIDSLILNMFEDEDPILSDQLAAAMAEDDVCKIFTKNCIRYSRILTFPNRVVTVTLTKIGSDQCDNIDINTIIDISDAAASGRHIPMTFAAVFEIVNTSTEPDDDIRHIIEFSYIPPVKK